MAKYYGAIGFCSSREETSPGVWEDVITEINYYGDILRNSRDYTVSDSINGEITVSNSISILADPYANQHFFNIRYALWSNVYWTVKDVEVKTPRLVLKLGGEYNGPKGASAGGA